MPNHATERGSGADVDTPLGSDATADGERAYDHGWLGAIQVLDNTLDDGLERAEEKATVKGSGRA
eukprot:6083708-Prymnesium_polylepis.1